jgi:ribosomal protein L30E
MDRQDEVNSRFSRCFVQNISKQSEVSVGLYAGTKWDTGQLRGRPTAICKQSLYTYASYKRNGL